jgi:hypothetical protein
MPLSRFNKVKFDADLDWATIREQEVVDVFEHNGALEVKTERDQWARTGNFAVEIHRIYKETGEKKWSGICDTDSYWWFIPLVKDNETRRMIVIKTKELQALIKKFKKENKYEIRTMGDRDSSFTTYGMIIPLEELINLEHINDYGKY